MQLSGIQRWAPKPPSSPPSWPPSNADHPFLPTDQKVVYRRYASLFFIAGCSASDNELIGLEIVHRYVEQMDKYYGNVCELDIIFNFQKAYFILDELLLAGEMQESSKKNVLRCISQQDSLEDIEVSDNCLSHITPIPLLLSLPLDRVGYDARIAVVFSILLSFYSTALSVFQLLFRHTPYTYTPYTHSYTPFALISFVPRSRRILLPRSCK